jgi:UDP-N-acetylmuramoylalanine-D-glutamate ligase
MSIMDFSGKHFLVIGAGISGRAASLALAGHGGSVTLNDMKAIDTAEQPWPDIKAAGVQLVFGSQETALLDGMDVVVPSPVISPEIPIMKEAARRGLPIWSEVEVACRVTDADMIGITGTNGKTTTTTLVGEIMKATGRQTVVGGNIGYGLSTCQKKPSSSLNCPVSSSNSRTASRPRPRQSSTSRRTTWTAIIRWKAMPLPRNGFSSTRTRAITLSSITMTNGYGPWRKT